MSDVPMKKRLSDAVTGVYHRNRERLTPEDASILLQARIQLMLAELSGHDWKQASENEYTCQKCGADSEGFPGECIAALSHSAAEPVDEAKFEELLDSYDRAVEDARPKGLPDKALLCARETRAHARNRLSAYVRSLQAPAPSQQLTSEERTWIAMNCGYACACDENEMVVKVSKLEELFAGKRLVPVSVGPDGYAYRYPSDMTPGATVLRHNQGQEVNGIKPIESVPFWFAPPPQAPGTVVPDRCLTDEDIRHIWKYMPLHEWDETNARNFAPHHRAKIERRDGMKTIEISAVHLRKEGDKVLVAVEVGGKWIDIIEEYSGAPFSHICEAGGIQGRITGDAGVAP